jgi:hypothetical protein
MSRHLAFSPAIAGLIKILYSPDPTPHSIGVLTDFQCEMKNEK